MKNKTISFENILPIDREFIISMLEFLKENSKSTKFENIQERLDLSESRTEKLVNKGVKFGFLSFKITFEKICNIDWIRKIVTLTEVGEKFLEKNRR